ncbi:putative protein kinase [Trypanosoma vivax]|nr:putative protein kinase [Trypanosoma vivax]
MRLTRRPHNSFTLSPWRGSHTHLSVAAVCPTCRRPLADAELRDGTSPIGERHFGPQYFRALGNGPGSGLLSICGGASESLPSPQPATKVVTSFIGASVDNHTVENEEDCGALDDECGATTIFREPHGEPMDDAGYGQRDGARGAKGTHEEECGYYRQHFLEIRKLGSGTFGGVYLCQHVMEGVALGHFALKKIPVGDNLTYLQEVLREVRILEEVKRHPNMVEYKHSWVDTAQLADFGPPVRCLFILMEYATMGSLDAYLERHGMALPTVAVWYFFLSAVAGTAHLHRKNIVHRDLKPQNLLLTGQPEDVPRVLVSDFGTASLLSELSYERTGGTGTVEYMAPELFECVPGREGTYMYSHTTAADVWSLGMILHYLACNGTLPTRLPNGGVLLEVERRSPYSRPPEMVELIRVMLHRDPAKRPTCEELLQSTVVRAIMRTLRMANIIADVFPNGASRSRSQRSTPVTPRSGCSGSRWAVEGGISNRLEGFSLDTPRSVPSPRVHPLRLDGCRERRRLQSPSEEPLMLQYGMPVPSRGAGATAARLLKPAMLEKGVQTDHVKIVYE